jgi:hypothetical protein
MIRIEHVDASQVNPEINGGDVGPAKVLILNRRQSETYSETGGSARPDAQVAGRWGHVNWNTVVNDEEKKFLYWADQSSQGMIKISCTGTGPNQPRKDILHLYSISPHLSQFQQHYILKPQDRGLNRVYEPC